MSFWDRRGADPGPTLSASLNNDRQVSGLALSRLGLLAAVGGVVSANIPKGFIEEPGRDIVMQTWVVPPEGSPSGHHGRTVPIVALGARKSYVSLFLMGFVLRPDHERLA